MHVCLGKAVQSVWVRLGHQLLCHDKVQAAPVLTTSKSVMVP